MSFNYRFMVREFYFDEKELKCEKEELMKLASDKKQQYVSSTSSCGPCIDGPWYWCVCKDLTQEWLYGSSRFL